jgi:Family of unknown function (DUF6386)
MSTITTDTATICLFDLASLQHRLNDVGDWWSIPKNELEEVNAGNALILNLGADGSYEVNFCNSAMSGMKHFSLRIPTGRIFIGQGEQLTGGGLEPDPAWGGEFHNVEAGNYVCGLLKDGNHIYVHLEKKGDGNNQLDNLINL